MVQLGIEEAYPYLKAGDALKQGDAYSLSFGMKLDRLAIVSIVMGLIVMSCKMDQNTPFTYWTEEDRQTLIEGLEQSRINLLNAVEGLSDAEWYFKEDASSWSIAEIVEHLGLQQDMHFREVYVLSKNPPHPEYVDQVSGNIEIILSYESDTTKGRATWNVEPTGRWCTKKDALSHFNMVRDKFIEFVSNTNADLKQHFTFRNLEDPNDYRNVRDLHQIVLTTISHTNRHVHQIEALALTVKNQN